MNRNLRIGAALALGFVAALGIIGGIGFFGGSLLMAKGAWSAPWSQECPFEATMEATSSVGSGGLVVDDAAGRLAVVGVEGLNRVEVEATACASREEWLEELDVSLEADGGSLRLETSYPDRSSWSGGDRAHLDLQVRIPVGLSLDVHDASGSISVEGSGSLRIHDSSGSIRAERILGDLIITDGSGSLVVAKVTGDVDLEDGSGSITVSEVGGSVTVEDGSGAIRISRVGGSVLIGEDSAGSIRVQDVEGDFTVEGDGGRGSISHSGVRGEVKVPSRRGVGHR